MEVEGITTELLAPSAGPGEVGVDGDVAAMLGLPHGHGGLAARVSVRGKKDGEEEKVAAGCSLSSRGGQGREEAAVEATWRRRSWRQCIHCRHRRKKLTGRAPCQ